MSQWHLSSVQSKPAFRYYGKNIVFSAHKKTFPKSPKYYLNNTMRVFTCLGPFKLSCHISEQFLPWRWCDSLTTRNHFLEIKVQFPLSRLSILHIKKSHRKFRCKRGRKSNTGSDSIIATRPVAFCVGGLTFSQLEKYLLSPPTCKTYSLTETELLHHVQHTLLALKRVVNWVDSE